MIHHVAITPGDFNTSKKFYTEVMGFPVVAAVKRQAMGGPDAGWTKHVFFDTGDGSLLALWDLHMPAIPAGSFKPGISEGLGLPWWVNHLAFSVDSLEALEDRKQHWLKNGMKVSEVDHDFIKSIYTRDPDGNLVEFTVDTRALDESDRIEAEEICADDTPATIPDYSGTIFLPDGRVIHAASSS
jgi:catechol 2,3-dioxygenase-like lactoylglutathione lyase family enzyme